jgi:hypothetical protein
LLTSPLSQQTAALAAFSAHAAREPTPHFAFFMEQGTGKSWVALALAERAFSTLQISQLIIVTLNGVHRNWTEREIPPHLSLPHAAFTWAAGALNTARGRAKFAKWRATPATVLRVMAINVEAFQQGIETPIGRLMQSLMRERPTLFLVDESDTIASPSAARTRTLIRLAPEAVLRLVLTGTPLDESPFDSYAQMKFLNVAYLGQPNFAAFKAQYAEFLQRRTFTGHEFPELVRYRNLDELKTNIARHSFTVRKADCLDLPPKVYQTRLVELGEEQRAVYRATMTQLIAELACGRLTIANALVRMTRLSQITGGFIVTDAHPFPRPIAPKNPKLGSLLAYVRDLPADVKVIIWARFVHECVAIRASLPRGAAVGYWGGIPDEQRNAAVDTFQHDPMTRYFVGTPSAGGRGLTLTAATQVVYFSSDFSSRNRRQSEDRAHRIGQPLSVTYTDLLAAGTIDEKIHAALAKKRELAELFMGGTAEALIAWLEAQ